MGAVRDVKRRCSHGGVRSNRNEQHTFEKAPGVGQILEKKRVAKSRLTRESNSMETRMDDADWKEQHNRVIDKK